MFVIRFEDVWEMYRIKFIVDGRPVRENFWALKDISFELEKGQVLGIIGENGSGKSTILKLIAGMLKPDRGSIEVRGAVSGLMELGAGFQPELTGRENLFLNAGLFGLSRARIREEYEQIVSFAGIGKFINAPVKCYSQGMLVRLAFAIAIHVEPDILLIDDSLAVGDEYFQRKCVKKIFEIKEKGATIVVVSHDMNMLSRLCKRALFLREGRIVADDLMDKVVPLYSQMIGARESVGILEGERLNLVFNKGRLFINRDGKLLTPNSGIYTVLLAADNWHSSLQADWEVIKENGNRLAATGRFPQLPLIQVWRLELSDDSKLKLEIEIDNQGHSELQEGYINIMLPGSYRRWFTSRESGEFPPIGGEAKNWQALLEGNSYRKCIGVDNTDGGFPSLIFEQSGSPRQSMPQILNTDYLANCRVLQYKFPGLQDNPAIQAERFVCFSGNIIIGISDIDGYLQRLEDEAVLSEGKLSFTFDRGRLILRYGGTDLTTAGHICTAIFAGSRRYFSGSANWKIRRYGKNRLIAEGSWHGLPATQIWKLEITGEAAFLWEINLALNEELEVQEQLAQFTCRKDYKCYFSEFGAGSFPDGFLDAETDILQKCIPRGAVGISGPDSGFPTLTLEFARDVYNFAKIFNSDFYSRSRVVRFERVQPEEATRLASGNHRCFVIKGILSEDRRKQPEASVNILQKEKLKFVFDNGKGRIYYRGKELTKRLSLYTSIRSRSRWYDSASSALWRIEEKTKDSIKAAGEWAHLPVVQKWEIGLREDNIIDLIITMIVSREIEAERMQANLMLSERYPQWISKREQGSFPGFKEDIGDDWDCVCSAEDSEFIGVPGKATEDGYLPSIIFSPKSLRRDWRLNIINSDIYHRGRVLQYLNSQGDTITPGEHPYFSGSIFVED